MDIAKAIGQARPGEQFVSTDGTLGGVVWHDATPKPDLAELEAAWLIYQAQAPVLLEIARLEAEVTARRIREATLGTDGGWLAAQDALIAIERAKL